MTFISIRASIYFYPVQLKTWPNRKQNNEASHIKVYDINKTDRHWNIVKSGTNHHNPNFCIQSAEFHYFVGFLQGFHACHCINDTSI